MGLGAFLEPLVVVSLLFGGTYVNRNRNYQLTFRKPSYSSYPPSPSLESGYSSPVATDALLDDADVRSSSSSSIRSGSTLIFSPESPYHRRQLRFLGWRTEVTSPNTRVFKDRFLSRLLKKYPFLVEAWYWALIYWVYQLGRAASALMLVEGTVQTARRHALQVIHLEQSLHIFYERPIQKWFMAMPSVMVWINRIYSFIHIPGTILFLVWLYYYTTTSTAQSGFLRSVPERRQNNVASPTRELSSKDNREYSRSEANPALYEARRRTMAMCNLIAFVIFTLWPCMPPRLLSDPNVEGAIGEEARQYGFVDTVHGEGGESSVWTQNKFCNQYAAMPSLHFGYSLLIGLTIMSIPVADSPSHRRVRVPLLSKRLRLPSSWKRLLCVTIGLLYPFTILIAIIATANHFILDAVVGAMVCGLAWKGNKLLLNLLPLEDWFLRCVRIHIPEKGEFQKSDESHGWD